MDELYGNSAWGLKPIAVGPNVPVMVARLNDVIPTLLRFDGEDRSRPVRVWLYTIESYGATYGWSQVTTMLAAKQCLEGSARMLDQI